MFRIWVYLNINFFLSFFFKKKNYKKILSLIHKTLSNQSKKKITILASQCRIGFLFILKYLKKKEPNKNEIIFSAYNLPEMINVAKNLNYRIKFCDINYKTGFLDLNKLKKILSNKTNSIVLTNMFNTYEDSIKLKKIAKKFNINLIEDNAIYFDNFTTKKKNYSGSVGDYSIYSFNIMKNISSFYGGAITTNNKEFLDFFNSQKHKLSNFNFWILLKQILIFFILKIMSNKILYKKFFFNLIKISHKKNIKFFLKIIYPSLRFIKKKFPNYYFTNSSSLSVFMTYLQLKDKSRRKILFSLRKKINKYYFEKLINLKFKGIDLIKIKDFNYQNFLDFPILVKNKNDLNNFMLNRGIEFRYKQYYNCAKMFGDKEKFKIAELYEQRLICLPNHPKVSLNYIDFIVKNLERYFIRG